MLFSDNVYPNLKPPPPPPPHTHTPSFLFKLHSSSPFYLHLLPLLDLLQSLHLRGQVPTVHGRGGVSLVGPQLILHVFTTIHLFLELCLLSDSLQLRLFLCLTSRLSVCGCGWVGVCTIHP